MDLKLIETGNGGDLVKTKKDLQVIEGFENMPYLAMFGGNVDDSTPVTRADNTQAFDWWGNKLFMSEEPVQQFNSLTERTLHQVALNSFGRVQIENAVKKDLEFMKAFAELDVSVSIESDDRLLINIGIQQPDNIQNKDFVFIWDATQGQLIDEEIGNAPTLGRVFDDTFDDTFV